jgi:hypothetical protein
MLGKPARLFLANKVELLRRVAARVLAPTDGRGYAGGAGGGRAKAEMLVRSEKTCVSEGESPSSLEARLPEFGTKVMNGEV